MTMAGSFNGWSFGPGTDYSVRVLSGTEDLPDVRSSLTPRPSAHGAFVGTRFLQPRVITLEVNVHATTADDFMDKVLTVKDATAETEDLLPLSLFDSTRRVECYVDRRVIPDNYPRTRRAVIEFVAPDPRVYDATLSSTTISLPDTTGGLEIPAVVPWSLGATTAGGSLTATNEGNFATRPIAVIEGPVDNPRVENITQSKTVGFTISLTASDTLTIDFDAHSVILNGTASRRNTMTSDSQWWDLPPGDSEIRFDANSFTADSTLTLSWRSAWI